MTSKKPASSKRASPPKACDYTKTFLKDWERLSRSGRYDLKRRQYGSAPPESRKPYQPAAFLRKMQTMMSLGNKRSTGIAARVAKYCSQSDPVETLPT